MLTYDEYFLRIYKITNAYALDCLRIDNPSCFSWDDVEFLGVSDYDNILGAFEDWINKITKTKQCNRYPPLSTNENECRYEETKQLLTDMFNVEL